MIMPHDAVILKYESPADLVRFVLTLQEVVTDVYIVSPTTLEIAVSPATMARLAL